MVQKEKGPLLQDLCARLPYGVICQGICGIWEIWDNDDEYYTHESYKTIIVDGKLQGIQFDRASIDGNICNVETVKPYLRPMSSMTEEEKVEYCDLQDKFILSSQYPVTDGHAFFDWLNKKMFDYRGLIPKRLALEAQEGMYNKKGE